MTFSARVYSIVKRIPQGKTLSYKEVAQRAGSPLAYRAVGTILSKNFYPVRSFHVTSTCYHR